MYHSHAGHRHYLYEEDGELRKVFKSFMKHKTATPR